MTKNDLLPLAKTYFDSSQELQVIYGTADGHFWYKEIQCQRYSNKNKVQYFRFEKADFDKKETAPKKLTRSPKIKED